MKNYEIRYDNDEEILKSIIGIILDMHPIVDDRSHILYPGFNEPRTPEMEISFNFYKINEIDFTQIIFLDGTSSYKSSVDCSKINIDGLLSKDVICNLINYLLTDHDYFNNIYKSRSSIELPMLVAGKDKNMHGISCGEINLKFDFYNHPEYELLSNDYFKTIAINFYDKLKETSTFKEEYSNCCNFIKGNFINSLTTEELRHFIGLLNDDDLCNLIYSMPNDRFVELYNEYSGRENVKKLTTF